jgi:hypothetical protein
VSRIEPDHIARLVRELHGYELDAAGAARCAEMLTALAVAVVALAPETQFHEEPATLPSTLASLAPRGD